MCVYFFLFFPVSTLVVLVGYTGLESSYTNPVQPQELHMFIGPLHLEDTWKWEVKPIPKCHIQPQDCKGFKFWSSLKSIGLDSNFVLTFAREERGSCSFYVQLVSQDDCSTEHHWFVSKIIFACFKMEAAGSNTISSMLYIMLPLWFINQERKKKWNFPFSERDLFLVTLLIKPFHVGYKVLGSQSRFHVCHSSIS